MSFLLTLQQASTRTLQQTRLRRRRTLHQNNAPCLAYPGIFPGPTLRVLHGRPADRLCQPPVVVLDSWCRRVLCKTVVWVFARWTQERLEDPNKPSKTSREQPLLENVKRRPNGAIRGRGEPLQFCGTGPRGPRRNRRGDDARGLKEPAR